MSRILTVSLALLLAGPVLAGGKQGAPASLKKIAPLLDPQTFAVVHVRLDKLDAAALAKTVSDIAKLDAAEAAMIQMPLTIGVNALKNAGAREVYGVATLQGVPYDAVFGLIPVDNAADGQKILNAVKQLGGANFFHAIEGFVVIGPKSTAERLTQVKPAGVSPAQLDKALAAAGDADARAALILPEALRKSLGEIIPELPKELGGGKTAPLLKGFQYVAIGANYAPKATVNGVLQMSDAKSAESARKIMVDAMNSGKKKVPPELLPMVDKAIALLMPKLDQTRLTWKLTEEELVPIAQPLVAKLRDSHSRMTTTNNLKQIGLAMHAYHDVNKHLPTNILDKQGKALLSWRVHLLPYIEQGNLYNQFKLDEPWDSPHNRQLIDKMSPVFRSPHSKAKPGHTTYLAPAGKDLFLSGTPLKMQEFKDGTSNTILVLDADDAQAVPWTKPDDLPIDPKQPLKGLGNNPANIFNALFADGSVRTISRKIDPAGFYGMLTVSGGEIVPQTCE